LLLPYLLRGIQDKFIDLGLGDARSWLFTISKIMTYQVPEAQFSTDRDQAAKSCLSFFCPPFFCHNLFECQIFGRKMGGQKNGINHSRSIAIRVFDSLCRWHVNPDFRLRLITLPNSGL
jgi:hypothetical protein